MAITYEFNPANLRMLFERTGLSQDAVAKATGISESSIAQYSRGVACPGIGAAIALADFFAVPLDFLVGRCSEELANNVLKDYGKHFMELRRAPFEAYLAGRSIQIRASNQACLELPWPYNLVEAVLGVGKADFIMGGQQEQGVTHALETLSKREKEAVELYFKESLSFEQIGQRFNVTRSRAHGITENALKKLRHPSRIDFIRYGWHYVRERNEIEQRRLELRKEQRNLDELAVQISKERDELLKYEAELPPLPGVTERKPRPEAIPLEEMDLTVRSYNCLYRGGCRSLANVMALAETGKLIRVRNFGRKSAIEVVQKLFEMTGQDYREANKLYDMEFSIETD